MIVLQKLACKRSQSPRVGSPSVDLSELHAVDLAHEFLRVEGPRTVSSRGSGVSAAAFRFRFRRNCSYAATSQVDRDEGQGQPCPIKEASPSSCKQKGQASKQVNQLLNRLSKPASCVEEVGLVRWPG